MRCSNRAHGIGGSIVESVMLVAAVVMLIVAVVLIIDKERANDK